MKKYVLVTGSNGLVGSESVKFFMKKNFVVLGIDNNQRKKLFGSIADTTWIKKKLINEKNYYHFNVDICNYQSLAKIFIKFKKKIKLIIHCAAQPSHDWAYNNPLLDFRINSVGTLNLLELFRKFTPNSKFIFTSTNKVYGDNPNKLAFGEKKKRFELKKSHKYFRGICESLSLDNCTHSLFGVSKAYADLAVQEYGKNFKLNTIVFRAGCITGPNHSGAKLHGFLSYLVKSCIKYKFYNVIGYKGKQVRDNIHSYDLIKCFWEYFKKSKYKGEVYNIGGGRFSNCSILEAISFIEKKLNIKVNKKITKQSRTGDHQWYISNNSKFKKHYPKWKQTFSTAKILNAIIDFELKKSKKKGM